MRNILIAAASAAVLLSQAPLAQAMPLAGMAGASSAEVTLVRDGCGPGFFRGPYGGCRPGGFGPRFGRPIYGRPFYRPGPHFGYRPY